MGRKTTVSIEKMLELHNEGKLNKEIAEILKLNHSIVDYHLRKLNVRSNKYVNKNLILINEDKILELHENGLNGSEIGHELRIDSATVRTYLKSKGLQNNYNAKRTLKIENEKGFCKRCLKWKKLESSFQKGRVGTPKEYYLAYCNDCRNTQTKTRLKTNFKSYTTNLKGRLKRKSLNLPFNITAECIQELWDKQNGKCFYSDYNLIFGQKVGLCPNSMSVDKIIPELGYVEGNIVLCSTRINTIKSNTTIEEMQKWMPDWYRRLKEADFVTVI